MVDCGRRLRRIASAAWRFAPGVGSAEEIGGGNVVARRQHDRLLDRRAQRAYVAAPGILDTRAHGIRGELLLPGPEALAGFLQEELDQVRNVFRTLAQRRNLDLDDLDAEVEVLAE